MIKNRWNSTILRKLNGSTPRRTKKKQTKTSKAQDNKENPSSSTKNSRKVRDTTPIALQPILSPNSESQPTQAPVNTETPLSPNLYCNKKDNVDNALPIPFLPTSPEYKPIGSPIVFSQEKPTILKYPPTTYKSN